MTQQDPTDVERGGLRALFDATADEATGPLLTKLRARAADVPAHVGRRPRFIPRWAWAPGFAGIGVAAAALAVTFSFEWSDPTLPAADMPSMGEAARAVVAPVVTTAQASSKALVESHEANTPLADELVGLDEWSLDGAPLGQLDPLDGLSADEDLDAWLFATAALAAEGG